MSQRNPYTTAVSPRMSVAERDRLILDMLPQVKYRAIRIYNHINRCVELQELISAGVVGLIDAVDRFDRNKGVKFRTYADLRIQGSIKDALRKMDWASRGHRQMKKRYEAAFNRLYTTLGRNPDDAELAAELGLRPDQMKRYLADIQVVHLGTFSELQGEEDEGGEFVFTPEADESEKPDLIFEKTELKKVLAAEIRRLSEKEALVLSLYYFDEMTMKEIGLILDVTESRISQIHNQAILRLKSRLLSSGKPARRPSRHPAVG